MIAVTSPAGTLAAAPSRRPRRNYLPSASTICTWGRTLEIMILLESILLRCPSMASYNASYVDIAGQVVKGLCAGCRDAGCVLTGGESAEMPGTSEERDIQHTTSSDQQRVLPKEEG